MVGILAFGSIRYEPGCEIESKIVERRPVTTPFQVEFARYSSSRAGGPTLVPVDSGGAQVQAELLVLDNSVTLRDAENMLWRRETRRTNRAAGYERPNRPGPNQVLVEELRGFQGLETVIYTDFAPSGKITDPNPRELAKRAIESAADADPERDGITYLMKAKAIGIVTPLISEYESEILELTGANTLNEALQRAHDDLSSATV